MSADAKVALWALGWTLAFAGISAWLGGLGQ